jgi:uncharacterized protein YjiS (DUF1127 family)
MTSAVLNAHAPENASRLATLTASLSAFIADFSSRNAANDDLAHLSAHQLEDIGLTDADDHARIVKVLWAA